MHLVRKTILGVGLYTANGFVVNLAQGELDLAAIVLSTPKSCNPSISTEGRLLARLLAIDTEAALRQNNLVITLQNLCQTLLPWVNPWGRRPCYSINQVRSSL